MRETKCYDKKGFGLKPDRHREHRKNHKNYSDSKLTNRYNKGYGLFSTAYKHWHFYPEAEFEWMLCKEKQEDVEYSRREKLQYLIGPRLLANKTNELWG